MQEKIIEILIYLIGELRKNIPLSDIDLSVLSQKGYTGAEISTACNWLYEKVSHGVAIVTNTAQSSPYSHRVLNESERVVISAEIYGYLIQMRELGLITDLDIEAIIDRIMMSGYMSISLEELKFMIVSELLENVDSTNHENRKTLNNNDTIH